MSEYEKRLNRNIHQSELEMDKALNGGNMKRYQELSDGVTNMTVELQGCLSSRGIL